MLKKMERQFEVLFLSKSDRSSDLYFRMIILGGSNQKEVEVAEIIQERSYGGSK